jgi:hypothetical protein
MFGQQHIKLLSTIQTQPQLQVIYVPLLTNSEFYSWRCYVLLRVSE